MTKKIILILVFSCLSILTGCDSFKSRSNVSEDEQLKLISNGNEIVQQSFKALSTELKQALETGGVQNAVGYCHLQASPITDSLSKIYHAGISRVSEKYRNPDNRPDELDLIVLQAYRQQLAQGNELQPHLEIIGDNIVYYSPIVIENPLCLLCHGDPGGTIAPENLGFIQSRYPNDLATGYKLGDLRGVWKISMKKTMNMPANYTVDHNEAASRFEVVLEGTENAVLIYRIKSGLLIFLHTEVPVAHEGKGIASHMAKVALEYARQKGYPVRSYCAYMTRYIERHPEYRDMLG